MLHYQQVLTVAPPPGLDHRDANITGSVYTQPSSPRLGLFSPSFQMCLEQKFPGAWSLCSHHCLALHRLLEWPRFESPIRGGVAGSYLGGGLEKRQGKTTAKKGTAARSHLSEIENEDKQPTPAPRNAMPLTSISLAEHQQQGLQALLGLSVFSASSSWLHVSTTSWSTSCTVVSSSLDVTSSTVDADEPQSPV